MRRLMNRSAAIAGVISLMFLMSSNSAAQKLPKSLYIQAQAMGTSTQLGRSVGITLIIKEFSTADDQKGLMEAFNAKGNEGLVNALDKMHSKGRMSITGTLGYDVAYIRIWKLPDGGYKIRAVTDRPIAFGEAWGDTRSMDYSLSGLEIIWYADKKKGKNSGTLLPAVKFKMNKENHLELEAFQNPWNLVNIQKR